MKKILITGANSYIGTSFEYYVKDKYLDLFEIETVDMLDLTWRKKSFTGYDVVFHVAGIAHQKETKKNAYLYYKVNTDLAIEVARKAKNDKVKQFVFLSSMSVYGVNSGEITDVTIPNPKSHYGKSKLKAEEGILSLQDETFIVSILRPPMVYGHGCKGNYNSLKKIALKLPIFPKVNNLRSMVYIHNLCEFVKLIIENCDGGIHYPQNKEYVNTSEMACEIVNSHGKRIRLIAGFAWLIKFAGLFIRVINKAFGSLFYNMKMSEYKCDYNVVDFKDSIVITEKGERSCNA